MTNAEDANKTLTVELTQKARLALSNSLNEVCNGIEVFEFKTRLGCSKEEVRDLHSRLSGLLP